MPKIIANLPEKLVQEACRQVTENGYSATTIRSVAAAVGVGVGTVYNHFPSKETLVAAFMLTDWTDCFTSVLHCAETAETAEEVGRAIHRALLEFADRHQKLFRDEEARSAFVGAFSRYHAMLRRQLAEPLRQFCRDDFSADFAAESLLSWTMAGQSFDALWSVLQRIF
ncbi:MAG: TetR/AcrR family transcriptional regulator [Oscillospiraceae bacterium]|nr:TetR/AcrR family transcriptional regulator [Oscillospiraceae bacterium]